MTAPKAASLVSVFRFNGFKSPVLTRELGRLLNKSQRYAISTSIRSHNGPAATGTGNRAIAQLRPEIARDRGKQAFTTKNTKEHKVRNQLGRRFTLIRADKILAF